MPSKTVIFFFAFVFSGCVSKHAYNNQNLPAVQKPALVSANLTEKSKPTEIEKAHLIDLVALISYSKNLKNIIDATQSR